MTRGSSSSNLLVRPTVTVLRLVPGPDGGLEKLVNVGGDTMHAISCLLSLRWNRRFESVVLALRIRSVQELLHRIMSVLLLSFA